MGNSSNILSFYDAIDRYLLVKIGCGVYHMSLDQTSNGNVVCHLKGVVVPSKSGKERQPREQITDCCVFTSWFDLMVYIYLQKVGNDEICQSSCPCDYMVISPSQSLTQLYEHLKRYEGVCGYIEQTKEGKVVNGYLEELLEEKYVDMSYLYAPWSSLITHFMSTYKQ